MRKSTQALLWSAAIFPGAGHLFLKCYARGIVLIAIGLISLSLFLFEIIRQASQAIELSLAQGSRLDMPALVATILQTSSKDQVLMAALWILILGWLFSMVDAYRLGKRLER